jgi:transcription elongation factor
MPAPLHTDEHIVLCCAVLCSGVETLGGKYELHDLVQLDAHTAGVIVGIDKDTARVLTNQSTLQKNDIRLCRVSIHQLQQHQQR